MDFLSHFPYSTIRPHQKEVLETLSSNWNNYDVFCIQAPTAFGKTALSRTLMSALRGVSAITPTNLLVQQFRDEFPDTPTLSRLDSYTCEEWKRPCSITRAKFKKFCKGCACSSDLATAKYRRGPGVYNYHTYMSHKIYRNVLIIDEAHNALPTIRDRMSLTMWRHDYKYPYGMWKPEQVKEWINSLPPNKLKGRKIQALKEAVTYQVPEYVYQRTQDWFNGKGTVRNEPELRDCIKLLPVDVSKAPPMLWPGLGNKPSLDPQQVQKVILLSATIGRKDVEQMGLSGKRVCYIACKSPIPAENRWIATLSLENVNKYSIENGGPERLARYIQAIAQDHTGEKGVIHVTYQLSNLLSSYLTGPRFIFHNKDNKADRYMEFRNAPAESGAILVACGMYEGMDLPEDLGRWQVIAKIPWGSLGNPAIKHLSELDPEWYLWETLKTTIQACGRVCRTPTDRGMTFVLDSSFERLLREGREMLPEWFTDAVVPRSECTDYLRKIGLV